MCRPKEVTAGEGESTLLNYLAPSLLSKRKSRKCTHHSETSSDVVMTAPVEVKLAGLKRIETVLPDSVRSSGDPWEEESQLKQSQLVVF